MKHKIDIIVDDTETRIIIKGILDYGVFHGITPPRKELLLDNEHVTVTLTVNENYKE